MQLKAVLAIVSVLWVTVFSGCKNAGDSDGSSDPSDQVSNVVESAIGEASDQATSIRTSGISRDGHDTMGLSPEATCSLTSARTCSGGSATISWGGCTVSGSAATLTGVISETYSGTGSGLCRLAGAGASVARVVSSSNPKLLTFSTGATLESTMDPGSAWDGTTFASASSGTVITRLETGSSNSVTCSSGSPCYHIVVNGIENVLTGRRGTRIFDHILTANLTAQGTKAGGDLVVSGTTTVWHQLAEYKAVNTLSNVTWGDSTCCYPTSGSVSTLLTGSLSGTATTTFHSTCGTATFVNTSGDSASIQLTQCQP